MTPEEARIVADLELIYNAQKSMLPPDQWPGLKKDLDDVKTQYLEARKIADDQNETKAQRDYAKGVCDSLAKGLPGIAKGSIAAASAFSKGDYMNGTAAIMDICAAAAPILGSLFAAGGPPGMLIGALFSVIGQILAIFGPKQPSLVDQIEKLMLKLEAEKELKKMNSVGTMVETYTRTLTRLATNQPHVLAMPLQTDEEGDDFWKAIEAVKVGLLESQRKLDSPEFTIVKVAEWLKIEGKQELDKWPEVLGVYCRVYTDLMIANMLFYSFSDPAKVKKLLAETSSRNTSSPLSPDLKTNIRTSLIALEGILTELPRQWADADPATLRTLNTLTQPARDRGLFVHLGTGRRYACTGKKAIGAGDWAKLYGDNITSISVTTTVEDAGKPDARYHCVVQEPAHANLRERTWHSRIVGSNPPSLTDERELKHWFNTSKGPSGVSGLWAIGGRYSPNEVWIYIAGGRQISEIEINGNNGLENRGWRSPVANAEVVSVRAVYPKSLLDDPDGDLATDKLEPGIRYGGLKASPDIFVVRHGDSRHGHVRSPWTHYKGIGADQNFLWVFGSGGFACATHASVMKCVEGQLAKPTWIEHYPNRLLYRGLSDYPDTLRTPGANEPPLIGMIDLCPCDDGTLSAIVSARTYKKQDSSDEAAIYTTSYSVDLKTKKINVGNWTKFGSGHGEQIIKLPIYCWPVFESLKARLQAKSSGKPVMRASRAASTRKPIGQRPRLAK